ncbi:hypothetical protein F4780DRAFT_744074 [Xylariomycetidae sp. FL0641]|nr:hypothetical protein F4780DRAFT_744074 [Xylariomycetidae sp. FL0641]
MSSATTVPLPTTTPAVAGVAEAQQNFEPRQAWTQTYTNADYTGTTTVAGSGSNDPTVLVSPASPEPADADGLTQQQIGIVVGTLLGSAVLGLLLWVYCIARRRQRRYHRDREVGIVVVDPLPQRPSYPFMAPELPRKSYWPPFPRSIPPPVRPEWVARVPSLEWTADDAARRATTTYI